MGHAVPLDWELLEERDFVFFIRPATPSVGCVLPSTPRLCVRPWNRVLLIDRVTSLFCLTNGLTLPGWEVRVEGRRGERSRPKMFSSAMCCLGR